MILAHMPGETGHDILSFEYPKCTRHETTPARGHELGPHFHRMPLGERRPAVHHQVTPQAIGSRANEESRARLHVGA